MEKLLGRTAFTATMIAAFVILVSGKIALADGTTAYPDGWATIPVTITGANLTSDTWSEGWRFNGEAWQAAATSTNVSITGSINCGGTTWSYVDYTYKILIQATGLATKVLLDETGTISLNGGSKSFSASFNTALQTGFSSISVYAEVTGGNPENSTRYTQGAIALMSPATTTLPDTSTTSSLETTTTTSIEIETTTTTTTTTSIPETTSSSSSSSSTSSSTTTSAMNSTTTTTEPGSACVKIGGLNLCAAKPENIAISKDKKTCSLKGPGVNINNVVQFSGNVVFIADDEFRDSGILTTAGSMTVPLSNYSETLFKGPQLTFIVDGESNKLWPKSDKYYQVTLGPLPLYGNKKPITVSNEGVQMEPMIYIGEASYALASISLTIDLKAGGNKNLVGYKLINGYLTDDIKFMTVDISYDPDEDTLEIEGGIAFPFMKEAPSIEGTLSIVDKCLDSFEVTAGVGDTKKITIGSGFELAANFTLKVENICSAKDAAIYLGGDLKTPYDSIVLSKLLMSYVAPYTFLLKSGDLKLFDTGIGALGGKLSLDPSKAFARIQGSTSEDIAGVFKGRANLGISYTRSVITGSLSGTLTIPDITNTGCKRVWLCKIAKSIIKSAITLPYTLHDQSLNVEIHKNAESWSGGFSTLVPIAGYSIGIFVELVNGKWDVSIDPNMHSLKDTLPGSTRKRAGALNTAVEQSITLDKTYTQVVFAATGTTGLPSIYLKTPQGKTITAANAASEGMQYFGDTENNVAFLTVEKASAGIWTIGEDTLAESAVEFEILGPRVPLQTDFTKVQQSGSMVAIDMTITPAQPGTTVNLYYTDIPDNNMGDLVSAGLSAETGTVSAMWDTASVPDGTYYLFSRTNDGISPPVTTRYDASITINNSGLQPPAGLSGVMAGDTARLRWKSSASTEITGYKIRYTDKPDAPGYPFERLATDDNETEVGGLDPTNMYRFCLSGFTSEGVQTPLSNAVTLVPCPAANLLGENAAETNLLRSFRDKVLSATPEGRALTELYYKHALELTKIITSDPMLRVKITAAIPELLPAVQQALEGKGLMWSRADMKAIDTVSRLIAAKAAPDLMKEITGLQKKLENNILLP